MKTGREISNEHDEAMEHADIADMHKRKGNMKSAIEEFTIAYGMERCCAEAMEKYCIGELNDPILDRDVMYRSAMFLANNAGLKNEARGLAIKLLSFTKYEEFIIEATKLLNELNGWDD